MLALIRSWLFVGPRAAAQAPWPVRVSRELEREQFRGEMLVTVVQGVLIVVLGAVYASAPKGFAPGAPIEAAPLGLVFFALLALLRLYAA